MKIRVEYNVPGGMYCWKHRPPHSICTHFDNEGGPPCCTLFQENLKENKTGVLKVTKCLMAGKETP